MAISGPTIISVFKNDGAGALSLLTTISPSGYYIDRDIVAAKINDDEHVDLLIGEHVFGGKLWLALNQFADCHDKRSKSDRNSPPGKTKTLSKHQILS